jgi:tetratricopeptide (TPR) repeat protein
MDMAPYQQEEEEARSRQRLGKEAVDLAVQGRWEEAEMVNRDIIEKFPADVEAYNRLGRALIELEDFARAKEAYLKALELAPNNGIAKKNLARLAGVSESAVTSSNGHHETSPSKAQARRVAPELFTAEMGKTGVANLVALASNDVLAKMGFGAQVYLGVKGQHLVVENEGGEYLGEVDPKQGLRLIKLIEGGNRYAAAILNVGENEARVIIKEAYRHPSQVGHLSFPVKATKRLRLNVKESLLKRKIIAEEGEAMEQVEYLEEAEPSKAEEESVPEGFFVLGEDGEKEEFEV